MDWRLSFQITVPSGVRVSTEKPLLRALKNVTAEWIGIPDMMELQKIQKNRKNGKVHTKLVNHLPKIQISNTLFAGCDIMLLGRRKAPPNRKTGRELWANR